MTAVCLPLATATVDALIVCLAVLAGLVIIVLVAKLFIGEDWLEKRRRLIRPLAMQLDLEFTPEGINEVSRLIDSSETLGSVDFQLSYNVLYGMRDGWRVLLFDMARIGTSGRMDWYQVPADRRTAENLRDYLSMPWTAAAVLGTSRLPSLVVCRRSVAGLFFSSFGDQSHAPLGDELARDFKISCEDEEAAREALSPDVVAHLKNLGDWTLELCAGGALLSTGSEWQPEEYERALDFLLGFVKVLPGGVLETGGPGPEA